MIEDGEILDDDGDGELEIDETDEADGKENVEPTDNDISGESEEEAYYTYSKVEFKFLLNNIIY